MVILPQESVVLLLVTFYPSSIHGPMRTNTITPSPFDLINNHIPVASHLSDCMTARIDILTVSQVAKVLAKKRTIFKRL